MAFVEQGLARVEARLIEEAAAAEDPLLEEIATDLIRAGGKRLRPRVLLLSYAAAGGRDLTDAVVDAAVAGELIHTASLVHDDVIDQSALRRGRPTVHVRYGLGPAIVAGDFLFTRAFGLSGKLGPRMVKIALDACTRLAEGEIMEHQLSILAAKATNGNGHGEFPPEVERYLKTIVKKTAEPIRAAAESGAVLAGAGDATVARYAEYGLAVGIAFQIQDDILDLVGDPATTGKPRGVDVRAGVLTLPALLSRIDGALPEEATRDADALARSLARSPYLKAAEEVALRYGDKAKAALANVPTTPYKDQLLALAEGVVRRAA
ncbi:MAG TPA: polyprenyl synthetase family protein [Candidatus Thermoplasmatota archaeon]|nr:polyprenyl synthetase family protein [Candidatus Thermoplasmatota archaeon]